jgi:hypothetical protein
MSSPGVAISSRFKESGADSYLTFKLNNHLTTTRRAKRREGEGDAQRGNRPPSDVFRILVLVCIARLQVATNDLVYTVSKQATSFHHCLLPSGSGLPTAHCRWHIWTTIIGAIITAHQLLSTACYTNPTFEICLVSVPGTPRTGSLVNPCKQTKLFQFSPPCPPRRFKPILASSHRLSRFFNSLNSKPTHYCVHF